jgi:hypothetical protein
MNNDEFVMHNKQCLHMSRDRASAAKLAGMSSVTDTGLWYPQESLCCNHPNTNSQQWIAAYIALENAVNAVCVVECMLLLKSQRRAVRVRVLVNFSKVPIKQHAAQQVLSTTRWLGCRVCTSLGNAEHHYAHPLSLSANVEQGTGT